MKWLLLLLLLCGCGGQVESPQSSRKLLIACIGDSETAGYSYINGGLIVPPGTSYPVKLAYATGYQVDNYGVGGATSGMILKDQFQKALSTHPDILIIMDGINDAIHDVSNKEYSDNNMSMISLAKAAGIRVIFLSPLTWDGKEERISQLRYLAQDFGAEYIDLTKDINLSHADYFCTVPTDYHPCDIAYTMIADILTEYLRRK